MKKIISLLIIALSSLAVFGQTKDSINIEFKIANPDQVPETEAGIKVFTDDKSFFIEGTTDDDGKFKTTLPTGVDLKIDVYQYDTTFNFAQNIPSGNYGSGYVPFPISIQLIYTESLILNVGFTSNSHELDKNQTEDLDNLFRDLDKDKEMTVEIGAHTDNVGSDEYNRKLSLRRAKSIKEYLVGKGISEKRMVSKGYGEAVPVADNNTEEGRATNRRVEVKIISK